VAARIKSLEEAGSSNFLNAQTKINIQKARADKEAVSLGYQGNVVDLWEKLAKENIFTIEGKITQLFDQPHINLDARTQAARLAEVFFRIVEHDFARSAVAALEQGIPELPIKNHHSGGHYRTWVNGQIAQAYARQILARQ
jgi:hypothetical protein